jgi:hypothetical protein
VFDYQAGEKYKLTLIMVGFAGLMAGMFFTLLLMPSPEPQGAHHRQQPKWASDPDVTGGRGGMRSPGVSPLAQAAVRDGNAPAGGGGAPATLDPQSVTTMMNGWLDLAWDMSAGSAANSQQKAIQFMTPACALAYQSNVWTPDIAKQIQDSGLKSTFTKTAITPGAIQADGTVTVVVEGQQILTVPGKDPQVRTVKVNYLLTQTAQGVQIAGISETGPG